MKIAILTAVWKRPEIFRLFCQGIEPLKDMADITVIVSGSEGKKSRDMVESAGYDYIEIPNQPLSKKMQSTANRARELDVDYVFCMGSDDVVHPGLFNIYLDKAREGYDYIGCLDWYFYDVTTGRALYWGGYREKYRKNVFCGAGRMLSKSLLDKMDWVIWNGHDSLLDNSMEINLRPHKVNRYGIKLADYGVCGLDIKSNENMTPMAMWDNTVNIDPEKIRKEFAYLDLPVLNLPRQSVSVHELRVLIGRWYAMVDGTAQGQVVRACIGDLERVIE